jgi:hypothetical protein
MRRFIISFAITLIYTFVLSGALARGSIQDPIADYLAMQVPDRSDYVGALEFIKRVKIDVDGDGKNEVFVGTWYRYMGSKDAFYWVAYKNADGGGYQRLTPSDADLFIRFAGIFAGFIQERAAQGLVQKYGGEATTPDSGELAKTNCYFYYIANGKLKEEHRGELDLSKPADKAIYERYFGEVRQTREIASEETFTKQQLQQMGYAVPNWEPPSP